MAAVLLDTTVLIDLLRGKPGTAARLRALRQVGDRPFVCAINVDEVERGIRNDREAEAAARLFEGMDIAPLGRAQGLLSGRWRREYAILGLTLVQADCLVAAAAVGVGATLATGNSKDFPMSELQVAHWPVGQ
ncbi:MAG: PIN domain-containing protein [Chloroflexi bacterium]|nr:PIN domain-containing protein [Chloroflexota bacterium]